MHSHYFGRIYKKSSVRLTATIILSLLTLVSCTDDSDDVGQSLTEQLIGLWQLEEIRVEGGDCKLLYGPSSPDEYIADATGCARPTDILGNAERCINVRFNSDGTGVFRWSVINGSMEDAPISYTIRDNEVRYCFGSSFDCSSYYQFIDGRLESRSSLTLDRDCDAVFVLTKN